MFIFLLFTALICLNNANSSYSHSIGSTNIVGGSTADIRDFPYQVGLLKANQLWCGGSILSEHYVLTAAHCVSETYPWVKMVITAGSTFWNNGTMHHIEHKAIFGNKRFSDVAVLRVKEPFVFDETRQPIPLFQKGEVAAVGTMGVVSGWGLTDESQLSDELMAVEVPIVAKKICNESYSHTMIGEIVDGEICAGIVGKDSCGGDSGSPLVIDGRQVGIVSSGYGCGLPDYPGVYIDVAFYYNWIMKQISP